MNHLQNYCIQVESGQSDNESNQREKELDCSVSDGETSDDLVLGLQPIDETMVTRDLVDVYVAMIKFIVCTLC